ncbi:MAG: tetratricopeptide repeat protein, partial [Candidatus Eisenbacteria bacterium]|nr:tetratricopeptide repeat protein [Candidatus Eisenbacteria bacterium]
IFNPATIRERLQNRLDLLKTGDRDRPARHQTLRQAIAWSYDLLSGSEQRAFRSLAVFAGGFTLESAEALLPDAAEAVEALLERSLLQRREEGSEEWRFLMLDTIRELGREKLQEAGEESAVRQAHADHYTALAEQAALHLAGPDQGRWLDRLDLEHDNLRAAWTWAMEEDRAETVWRLAAALWRFWLSRGHLHEGWRKAETLPPMPAEQSDTDLRARALHGIGTLAHNLARNHDARRILETALGIWRRRGDRRGMATELINLGWVAAELSDLDTAQSLSEEGLKLQQRLEDRRGVALALNNLGWVAAYRGDYDGAERRHSESLALRRSLGDQRGIAFALVNVASALRARGEYDSAHRCLGEALQCIAPLNDRLLLGYVQLMVGWTRLNAGALDPAAEDLRRSLANWKRGGNVSGIAWTTELLGEVAGRRGDPREALGLLEESLAFWRDVGSEWGTAETALRLGRLALERDDAPAAEASFDESLRYHQRVGHRRGVAEVLEGRAVLARRTGRLEEAVENLAQAASLRRQSGTPVPRVDRAGYDALLRELKESLPEEAYQRAWAHGEALGELAGSH